MSRDNKEDERAMSLKSDGGSGRNNKKEAVKQFVRHLRELINEYQSFREKRFKEYFGCNLKEINSIKIEYPPYKRSQAISSHNDFLHSEVLEGNIKDKIKEEYYNDMEESAPAYESLRVSRDKYRVFLTIGYQYFIWKGVPLVQDLYFEGTCRYFHLYFRRKDIDKASEFLDGFYEYMQQHNLFKGEKLLYSWGGTISFLEYSKLDWNNVILSQKVKQEFELNLLTPLNNKATCDTSGIPWRRGLLLGGPPGTGKTQVCRILCNVLKDTTIIWATPKAVQDEDEIAGLFDAARYFAPTLLIIEDIDFIGSSRDFAQDPSLGELLTQLDGNDPNHGLFVMATTNRPEMLDSALANRPSRFDVLIEFKLPDPQAREELIKLFSKDMKFEKPLDVKSLALATKDLTGAQIKETLVYAQLKAIQKGKVIDVKDILERIESYKPRNNAAAYRG